MIRKTGAESQVELYQRLKKELDVALLNSQYVKVKIKDKGKAIPGGGVSPSLYLGVVVIGKGSLQITLKYGRQFIVSHKARNSERFFFVTFVWLSHYYPTWSHISTNLQ